MVDQVDDDIRDMADEAEDAAAASEEQASATSLISDQVEDLAAQSSELRSMLSEFTVERDSSGDAPDRTRRGRTDD